MSAITAELVTDEVVSCVVCDTPMRRGQVGDFEMLLCAGCGLGRIPEMATSDDFWQSDVPPEEELANPYWTARRAAMFRKSLKHFEARRGTGRILDLGGGIGFFAECALLAGWDAYSLDISEPAQAAATERLGRERSLRPEDASRLIGSCDVVTLWCVVAHTLDPVDLVRQAVDLLKPGGLLLVTTPNFIFQGTIARLLDKLDKPYDLVSRDHILHYTPKAAGRLLQQSGLDEWSFEYLGVTDNCFLSPRLANVLVPLKRVWNFAGSRISRLGVPPICAELQIVAVKPG